MLNEKVSSNDAGRLKGNIFFFLFFFVFLIFLAKKGNVLDGEFGNKERSFFSLFISSKKKIIIGFVRNTKNAAKYENKHQQADPSTSPFSFRCFTMWRILMSCRYVLPLQPAREMLIFCWRNTKVGGLRGGNWNYFCSRDYFCSTCGTSIDMTILSSIRTFLKSSYVKD